MSFWEKNVNSQNPGVQYQPNEPLELDEETAELMGISPDSDVFEEEEDDLQSLMNDANLRLEQGRLYQMVLQNDIFADTNADPRAIRNVQREIRKHAKERLETLLGIRQEQQENKPTLISSPFNDIEVTVLKMLASRASKGESERPGPQVTATQVAPKKDGITSISGTVKHASAPIKASPTPLPKSNPQPIKKTEKSAIKRDSPELKITKPIEQMTLEELDAFNKSNLKKPIDQMTSEELAAHDKATLEQRSKNYARMPTNLVPHPSPQALEMLYTSQVAQHAGPGSAVGMIAGMMNSRNK